MALTVKGRKNPKEGLHFSESEVAEKMGMSVQRVNQAMAHAVRMLWRISVIPQEEYTARRRLVLTRRFNIPRKRCKQCYVRYYLDHTCPPSAVTEAARERKRKRNRAYYQERKAHRETIHQGGAQGTQRAEVKLWQLKLESSDMASTARPRSGGGAGAGSCGR